MVKSINVRTSHNWYGKRISSAGKVDYIWPERPPRPDKPSTFHMGWATKQECVDAIKQHINSIKSFGYDMSDWKYYVVRNTIREIDEEEIW